MSAHDSPGEESRTWVHLGVHGGHLEADASDVTHGVRVVESGPCDAWQVLVCGACQGTFRLGASLAVHAVGQPSSCCEAELRPMDPTGPEDSIGRFRLLRPIGQGGMGEVWEAEDESGRRVALKVVNAEHRPAIRRRLEREGQVLASLDHPNVVGFVEQGQDGQVAYLAMELVEGGTTLQALLRAGGEIPHKVSILEGCARGLAAVHAAGLLHRDLKPSNVLITPSGEVKLSDFGIALADDVSERLTGTGEAVGTPHYVAPEVVFHNAWSQAGDVYGLGCLAFRLLTGRHVFQGRLQEVLQAHMHAAPPSVSELAETPVLVDALVEQMLSKAPEERPTALEAADLLGMAAEQGEGTECPRGQPGHTRRRPRPTVPRPRAVGPGSVFRQFQVLECIGRGGMGIVYKAFHTRLKKLVALKVLPTLGQNDEVRERRFLREAEAAARLDHPYLVPVLDAGIVDGTCFLAMDLVEGEGLAEFATNNPDPPTLLRMFVKICEAVAHAHARGVIHRDLKPENILVDLEGNPRVLDFGVAKKLDDGDEPSLTSAGDVLGTLRYMPPEQASGDTEKVDVRSDVYSLGAILYHLLTGTPPFQGNKVELLRQVLMLEPLPPSERPGTRVPWELDAICLKALHKDPEARYVSALALKRDVGAFLEGRPIMARRASSFYAARKWLGRNPCKLAALTVVILCVLSLLGGYNFERRSQVRERHARIVQAAQAGWALAEASDFDAALTQFGVAGSLLEEGEVVDYPGSSVWARLSVRELERWRAHVGSQRAKRQAQHRSELRSRIDDHARVDLGRVKAWVAKAQNDLQAAQKLEVDRAAEARQLLEQAREELAKALESLPEQKKPKKKKKK